MRVTVATLLQRYQADSLVARLEASGIQAWLADESVVAANPLWAIAVGGIKVQVEPENVALARALVEAKEETGDGCLSCGAAMEEEEQACAVCGWTFL